MKRQTFLKAIDVYSERVVAWLAKRIYSRSYAREAVHDMIVNQLESKAYCKFDRDTIDGRIYSYLKRSAKYQAATLARKFTVETSRVCSVELDPEQEEQTDFRDKVTLESNCPFCHNAPLNRHKACAACHTIVGQGGAVREQFRVTESDLQECPDIDMNTDVKKAFASLTPFEQSVIKHAVYGNETLDDLAGEGNQAARQAMWRTYVKAKRKLQSALLEYSV